MIISGLRDKPLRHSTETAVNGHAMGHLSLPLPSPSTLNRWNKTELHAA